MPDRTDQPRRPANRGPWPEITDLDQIFDRGQPWCLNAEGHPGPDDQYPDPSLHFPPHECRSGGLTLPGADEAYGKKCDVEIYLSAPYRFGQPRTARLHEQPRVVVDLDEGGEDLLARISLNLGDALRLALHLQALIQLVDRVPQQ